MLINEVMDLKYCRKEAENMLEIENYFGSLGCGVGAMLAKTFAKEQIVVMDLLPPDLKSEMRREALSVLKIEARRRELTMESTGGTPRAYNSVGRDAIKQNCRVIPSFFNSPMALEFLSQVAGEPLYRVPYEPEEYIVNSQCEPSDTHGWHWDDYAYALVWAVESPNPLMGGRVEFIPNTEWDKTQTREQMQGILGNREVKGVHINEGQCYLLKARYALHRVAPLTGKTRRTVIVFTYANQHDLNDSSISHETMEAIYAPEQTAKI